MSICNLPLELTLLVVENLEQLGDVHALLLVNQAFASLLQPVLRNLAIKSEYAEKALYRAAASRNESILRLLMDKGPKIIVCVDYWLNHQTAMWAWYRITNFIFDPMARYASDFVTMVLDQGTNLVTENQKGKIIPALHWALANDDERLFRLLMRAGPNLDMTDSEGDTSLHIAVRKGAESVVRLLLQQGADCNIKNFDWISPAYCAPKGNDTLAALLFENVDLEEEAEYPDRAMYLAAQDYGVKAIGVLFRRGLNVNLRFKHNITALHVALCSGNVAAARFLLENGADPNARDDGGRSPFRVLLNCTETRPPVEIGGLLIEKGADINVKYRGDWGVPMLHLPIHSRTITGDEPTTRWLLENGADPSAVDDQGGTALHIVARFVQRNKQALFMAMILEYNVDVNIQDRDGRTALHIAAKCQMSKEGVKLLLDAGANVNLRDKKHRTPLQLAAKHSKAVVGILLDYGADVDDMDSLGRPEISEGLRKYFSLAPYCSFVDKRLLSGHTSG